MKTPTIKEIPHEPFAVIKQNGDWLQDEEVKKAYEGMIDVLIDTRAILNAEYKQNGRYGYILGQIENALKDAGVEL